MHNTFINHSLLRKPIKTSLDAAGMDTHLEKIDSIWLLVNSYHSPSWITESLQNLLLDLRLKRENTEDFPLSYFLGGDPKLSPARTYEIEENKPQNREEMKR